MEREAKKRKTEYVEEEEKGKEDDDDEEEEEEEEKMEKFFALLRSTKQMHDQIRRNSNRIFKEKEEIRKVGEEKVSVAWNPSFLPEDFLEDGKDGQAAAGPSKRKEEEKKDEGEEGTGLDLKLSL
ncbi:PREDICTED: protein NIM1-INTERACTING 1-like [Populus euphratica]|uniref:Protein NIM1-INTERACTING 1-like n=1 Tax=Populus euphratica TaxID=75702 RepID=A0AAJ6V0J0_POPEU|nr:PREDICTED: protein NIM1-INTERACTING 1-like [Populus euphratica]XP_011038994.1 PREDICTED: protein NIM1-INTERACTING 1-like [Populus euphratica]XP_011038998.1 PREDICTED: protein NIM1-INTERACTING 1-like [Populus euphratica]XP_011038999.1 PREDICTED: protein NIM1-INTERACTING 1-like [Populus euphratica]